MSNNPLEAVTQAVNSLVTALKLPDESAKANEVLGEMSFPQFSRLLPYRDYNQESGLFMNDTTMGFMLEAIPINGANESIVEALDHMLRTKLPRGVPFCIHLMSSQLVGDRIEYGLREFSWSGEQAERFNAIIRDNEGRVFARQGEVMNPLQYVPFNQTLYFINGDDPAQVAWMKRQTPPTLESKIILVQGSIPEMQKSLDSRVYFDQNGVLCQRLGIDQVPARVSAVPGDRFLKVEFIPAEEGRK